MQNCRVLLTQLTDTEQKSGYSQKGLYYLTGQSDFIPVLPFNRQDFSTLEPRKQQGMSISGYQPKLQLVIHEKQFQSIAQQGNYILKPSPEDYPFLAENEHATMQLMAKLGFVVPENGLIPFQSVSEQMEYAFVIKRFDRTNDNKSIHQEQLDGAMNVTEKYGKTGSDNEQYISYEQAVKFILQHTENNLAQQQELFRRIVYAYLLGNNDLHLRNFSLVYSKTGEANLAPVYDYVSVVPYKAIFEGTILALPLLVKEEGNKELAHGFTTKYGEYIGQDFIEFGENIGLNRKVILKKLLPQILKEKTIVESVYQRSFMPLEHQALVLKNYYRRLQLLQILDEPSL
ncbi:type II toxin-antitoxin system HipA family toxin [Actinobacillus equuli]|uniref:type II toxin-antitoxin system HipA family toxin n=1 Tax=Actinobacillus equuli TaxID=718 RepID=UPI0024431FBF|nr:HipA domain-containing protein [Actinobacillus equuli]WGE41962.1 HipA domain-containing protein [Actinobacillus equuli subsp. haemolyticus]WGE46323.1 HipA domain-containing protein [Actinobacillus equuli subsp. haemolyticus]WGE52679.1 HipA domain-containing protein [Actinobacillus equuli subsp. haemolyticus]WGE58924.1 HipA domain-containing protein [Actinobacillus equuli subsp. haemolyticus]WGE60478.1 HipA domain-containing protein [Actinobacillus equuli subsp. haemolyticus]